MREKLLIKTSLLFSNKLVLNKERQKKEEERKSALLDRRALFLSDLFITSKQRDDESS
tara:strand:+ start:337 stop:510 length:174 start_codon:yes stop_codon:yes gene_type:complete